MKKSRKTAKKMSNGQKALVVLGGVGLIGATVGVMSAMGGSTTGEVVVNVESDSTLKAPLEVISSDVESGDLVTQEVYLSADGKEFTFNTSEEYSDVLIAGNEYTVYLLDSNDYGSSMVLNENDKSKAVATGDGGFTFTLGELGTDLKVEVNLISDYNLKAEDEINGEELFVSGSDAYTDSDTVVFANETGGIIDIDDEFEATVFIKPTTSDAVANDNGLLIVVDTDDDEWEDLSVSFAGAGLTELSRDDLKEMFAEVNYENFRTKTVYMVDKDVAMEKNSEYEMVVSATLVDGASITADISAEIYTLGYISTADGRELSALDSEGNALHGDVDKSITFNLA